MTREEARDELGVGAEATAEQIKAAYKQHAKRVHPDRGGTDEQFRRVKEAYETLGGRKANGHTKSNGKANGTANGKANGAANGKANGTGKAKNSHERAFTYDEGVEYMNKRYAWINSPGSVAYVGEGEFEFRRVEAFRIGENNKKIIVGTNEDGELVTMPLANWWLASHERASYSRVGVWAPPRDKQAPLGAYNMWRGFAVKPRKGDWSRMRAHHDEVIAAGVSEIADYYFRYKAWAVQHPGERAEAAFVMRGEEGAGKGIDVRPLVSIFGRRALQITNPDHFVGSRFNAHLAGCSLLFVDEAYWSGDRKHEGTLKALITEPTIMIESKGLNAVPVDNILHPILSSNNSWVVPAGAKARRFTVTDVCDKHLGDRAYFEKLNSELANGGTEAMLHDLLEFDLGDWHPRMTVDSAALQNQKERSLSLADRWVLGLLEDADLPIGRGWHLRTASSKMLREHAEERFPKLRDASDQDLFGALKKAGATKCAHPTGSPRGWELPELAGARAKWCTAHYAREWERRAIWNGKILTGEPCERITAEDVGHHRRGDGA